MKDIDGQEIHVGDVVLDCWENRVRKVKSLDEAGKAVWCEPIHSNIKGDLRGAEEIFCLFYRKPTNKE